MKYLKEISGNDIVPDVPLFYVNCLKPEKEFVVQNLKKFEDWVSDLKKNRYMESPNEININFEGYTTEIEKEINVKIDTIL